LNISPLQQSNLEIITISSASHQIIRDMFANDLIDHSPQQPEPVPPLASASNVVLIDNFDSFSWNIYQYLVLEGATVTVFRNDEISVEKLAELRPTQLVISPGPGHPKTDSGISRDAIKHFAGKIPVFGVCMGQFVARVAQ
jgi:anthranilate synthase/indole-3-glycerol phosphate synthase/phosphoribosylanthranilate isomerase